MQPTISARPRPAAPAALLLVTAGAASARDSWRGGRNPGIDPPERVPSIWP